MLQGALFSSCKYPPFSLKGKWGDTRHPSLWKEQVFEKHSFASQWQSLGDGRVGEEEQHRHIPEVESCTKPHLARYFSGEHIHLSPIFFICDFIDKDTNIFELWAVVLQRRTVFYLCVLCGPDGSGQCDLFEVIFWTSVRWQLEKRASKNTLLKGRPASGWQTTQTLQEKDSPAKSVWFVFKLHLPRWTLWTNGGA